MTLSDASQGSWRIERILGPVRFRSFLMSLGFTDGTDLTLIEKIFPGIIVRVRGSTVAFSPEAAALVEIRGA